MVVSTSSLPATTVEAVFNDRHIQAWLKEKHWELAAPDRDWNYWHIELGDGNILPVTPLLLTKMYQKDHP
ncbi:MAG: hypothetical protein NW220_22455 [Leptolyngbyaceae cyanobacterium bins.349]|nr:hypothetical protein [Leptolyngbyaceae cyanobacterium bins.349]